MATSAEKSYEQVCAEHEWHVPERYNIAADVCDRTRATSSRCSGSATTAPAAT